jgi:hypothetical protein
MTSALVTAAPLVGSPMDAAGTDSPSICAQVIGPGSGFGGSGALSWPQPASPIPTIAVRTKGAAIDALRTTSMSHSFGCFYVSKLKSLSISFRLPTAHPRVDSTASGRHVAF